MLFPASTRALSRENSIKEGVAVVTFLHICYLPAGRNKKLPGGPSGFLDDFNEKLLSGSGPTCPKRVSNQHFKTGDV